MNIAKTALLASLGGLLLGTPLSAAPKASPAPVNASPARGNESREAEPPSPTAAPSADRPVAAADFDRTSSYTQRTIRGWNVYINHRLVEDEKELGDRAIELLDVKLFDINRALPPKALEKLHTVVIWLELKDRDVRGACFHPSRGWLAAHGFNPEKAGAVEIGNAVNFLKWTREQPAMVLHELAHAYHFRDLGGYDNPEIVAAYKRAMQSKLYDAVLCYDGHTKRAYAPNNAQEYFAELTEPWFGTNDFYPFVRPEVLRHDPEMAKLLKKLWGE